MDFFSTTNTTSPDDTPHKDLYGFLAVLGSVLAFGMIGVPMKFESVRQANVDPLVYQLYYSFAIFVTSWLVWTYQPVYFTPYGIAAGCLWVPSSVLSIFAIKYIGMSVSQGLWSGTTIIVSFLWGAIAFPSSNPIDNIYLAILGLCIIIIGIAGLSFCTYKDPTKENLEETEKLDQDILLEKSEEISVQKTFTLKEKLFGLTCALGLGLLNGSLLVPLNYVPSEYKISFVASEGCGIMLVTPIFMTIYFAAQRKIPEFQFRAAFIPGTITGIFWSIGNLCSVYATNYLGLTVGYPLTQLALIVAGLWGIFYYREITGWMMISIFFLSAAVLLAGAALLSVFG